MHHVIPSLPPCCMRNPLQCKVHNFSFLHRTDVYNLLTEKDEVYQLPKHLYIEEEPLLDALPLKIVCTTTPNGTQILSVESFETL